MTHELITNRYQQKSPTHIQANGCSISTPIYLTPTTDQSKALLNGFRAVVSEQRKEMGFDNTRSDGTISVVTTVKPPLTPAEEALGMNEESLRYALFQRKGIPDRLIIKLQQITGIELVSREAIIGTIETWLDHLELNEKKRTKRTNKTANRTQKTTCPAT